MNRIGFLSALLIGMLAFSSPSQAKGEKKSPPVELVRRLYRDFAWEAVLYPEPGETLVEQSKGRLKDYFDGGLAELLVSDAECARKRSPCRLDVNPLFGTRDPVAHNLEVVPTDNPTDVLVRFLRADAGSEAMTEIVIEMTGSGSGARISDVLYPNGPSLKVRLTTPLE